MGSMAQLEIIRRKSKQPLSQFGSNALLARIYSARGLNSPQELDYKLSAMLAPELLGLDAACERLYQALKLKQHIVIIGDFDADGATSTALLLKILPQMGFAKLNYLVPNRFDYGYGLSVGIVDEAKRLFNPDLLLTVDNGIANLDGAERAYALGMEVIITDHHLPPPVLPRAAAIVNPNQIGDTFASKNLAGVGVAFYLCVALRAFLRDQNHFKSQGLAEPDLRQVLDLVALGTVADVVTLDHNNRLLVYQGLTLIRKQQCCAGISALFKVAKREQPFAKAADLGFAIAPRLNAAGRLEDIGIGIECLLATNIDEAADLAQALDDINIERREIEQEMKQQAFEKLAKLETQLKGEELAAGLCLYQHDWHQGVVGILAARIKERYQRPVVIFASEDANNIKGSARSIAGVHIRDVLVEIDKQQPALISKFGGHAMAAGLSLPLANLDAFSKAFAAQIASISGIKLGRKALLSDGELQPADLTLLTADQIHCAEPFGHGFPAPQFDGVFKLISRRVLKGAHLKVQLGLGDQVFDGIIFNETGDKLPDIPMLAVEVVYTLDINRFMNRQSLQFIIEMIRPHYSG